ncbi:MAG: hypothetical protein HP496_17805 [Nitrospira sp.]|nr:hypothetical protein [Nitrospira sp.]
MKVLTVEELGIATGEGVDVPLFKSEPLSLSPHTDSSILTEQQETFLRDRFSTKLEDPETGRWIRSWHADGE